MANVTLSGIACTSGGDQILVSGFEGNELATVSRGYVFEYTAPGGNDNGGSSIVAPLVKNNGSQKGKLTPLQMGAQINGTNEFRETAQPMSMVFDEEGALFICDQKSKSILSRAPVDRTRGHVEDAPIIHSLVSEYEGKPLLGPNSLCFDDDGTLFFTDSGPFSTFSAQKGSVFCVNAEDQMLKSLAFKSIAYPSGIACQPSGSLVYVSETNRNRILRFARRSNGVYYSSVWHNFTGGYGPTCLLWYGGMLYVARSDLRGAGKGTLGGSISLVNEFGEIMREIPTPAPEVWGMCFRHDPEDKTLKLVISERSTNKIWQAPLDTMQPLPEEV